jgi:hypothetical protein
MKSNNLDIISELDDNEAHDIAGGAFGWSHQEQIGLGVGTLSGAIVANTVNVIDSKANNRSTATTIGTDTYTQVMEQPNAAQGKRPLRPPEHRSSPSIKSAIPEGDRFCGRGNPQSGRWCATNPGQ